MKYLKVILFCVLLSSVFFAFSPIHAQEDVEIWQGTCGENISWTYDEYNKTLTITGTGRIPSLVECDYRSPWMEFHKTAQILIIEPGITTIGSEIFKDGFFSEVILPDTLTTIEHYAFTDCRLPDYFSLPDSVTTIENNAFYKCSFYQLQLPENLSFMGSYAFAHNQYLSRVYIPSSLIEISKYAFFRCENLSNVYISEGVEKIGSGAFNGTSLTTLTIPNSVTHIERMALTDCPDLVELRLGNGITEIENYSFGTCKKIYYNGTTDQWNSINLGSNNLNTQKTELITLSSFCEDSHQYQLVDVIAPTCTEVGYTSYTCIDCGHNYLSDCVQPAGHLYGNWQPCLLTNQSIYCNKGVCQKSDCGQEYLFFPYKMQVTTPPDEINVSSRFYSYDDGLTRVEHNYTIVGGELALFFTDAPPLTLPLNTIPELNIQDPFSSEIQPIEFLYPGYASTTIHFALTIKTTNTDESTQPPSTTEEVEVTTVPSSSSVTETEEATPEQTTAVQPTEEYTTVEQSSVVQTSEEQTTVEQASEEQTTIEQSSEEQTAVEQSSEEQTAVEQTSEEQTADEQASEEQTTVEQMTVDNYSEENAESIPSETISSELDDIQNKNSWILFGGVFAVILCTLVGLFITKKSKS